MGARCIFLKNLFFSGGYRGGLSAFVLNPPSLLTTFLNIYENEIRPNYFIFMGYLSKMSKANPHTFIHMNPLSRNPGSAPAF